MTANGMTGMGAATRTKHMQTAAITAERMTTGMTTAMSTATAGGATAMRRDGGRQATGAGMSAGRMTGPERRAAARGAMRRESANGRRIVGQAGTRPCSPEVAPARETALHLTATGRSTQAASLHAGAVTLPQFFAGK